MELLLLAFFFILRKNPGTYGVRPSTPSLALYRDFHRAYVCMMAINPSIWRIFVRAISIDLHINRYKCGRIARAPCVCVYVEELLTLAISIIFRCCVACEM